MENLQVKQKKIAVLIGRLLTPIVISKSTYWKHGCLVKVVGDPKKESKPLFTSIGKLVYCMSQYPSVLQGFRGYVKVSCMGYSEEQLKRKIGYFLQKTFLGTKTAEGLGRVIWESCEIKEHSHKTPTVFVPLSEKCPQCKNTTVIYDKGSKRKRCFTCNQTWCYKKFKIRAGIRADYPEELQRLLIALMLHDFVHTEKHNSKIFQQIDIEDEEIREACLHHHTSLSRENPYHSLIQYYDGFASYITRKKPFKTIFRYNKLDGSIDFKQLKKEIEGQQNSHIKLYSYIHCSQELNRIVESMLYGKSTLQNHLLIMVNLAINDYYDNKLKINKGIISLSASRREELNTAMDAEMHSFTDHDTVNSERATTSMKRRLEA